jgi:hypothetical protein
MDAGMQTSISSAPENHDLQWPTLSAGTTKDAALLTLALHSTESPASHLGSFCLLTALPLRI